MKYIFLGIKDYCKDCWHDFLLEHLFRFYKRCPIKFISNQTGALLDMTFWKEGNLWHYIKQRKIANKLKKDKENGHQR